MTLEEYSFLLEKQNSVCAICGQQEKIADHRTGKLRSLAVDHVHKTGEIRGWLCGNCNKALGLLGDDLGKIIERLLKYQERRK